MFVGDVCCDWEGEGGEADFGAQTAVGAIMVKTPENEQNMVQRLSKCFVLASSSLGEG